MSPDDVKDFMIRYSPRVIPHEVWTEIRAFVLVWFLKLEFGSKSVLQLEVALFVRFIAWCRELGLPLEIEAMLTPTYMEAFFADASTPKATSAGRWSFHRWGRALTRNAPWPEARRRKRDERTSLFQPYTDDEVDQAWKLADRQTTELRRRTAIVLIGLCEGAGLQPGEAKWVTPEHLSHDRDALWVSVIGPNARTVPIRPRYVSALDALAASVEPSTVLTGRDPRTHRASDLSSVILHHVDLYQAPRISGRRLRHSWLRRLIEHDVPIRDIYQAAGVLDAKTLLDALRSLKPTDPDSYLRNLLAS